MPRVSLTHFVLLWLSLLSAARAQNVCTDANCAQLTGPGPWPSSANFISLLFSGSNIEIRVDADSQYKYNLLEFPTAVTPANCNFDSRLACAGQVAWDAPSSTGCLDELIYSRPFDGALTDCDWDRTDTATTITFSNSLRWTGVRDRGASLQQRETTRLLTVEYPKVNNQHFLLSKPLINITLI